MPRRSSHTSVVGTFEQLESRQMLSGSTVLPMRVTAADIRSTLEGQVRPRVLYESPAQAEEFWKDGKGLHERSFNEHRQLVSKHDLIPSPNAPVEFTGQFAFEGQRGGVIILTRTDGIASGRFGNEYAKGLAFSVEYNGMSVYLGDPSGSQYIGTPVNFSRNLEVGQVYTVNVRDAGTTATFTVEKDGVILGKIEGAVAKEPGASKFVARRQDTDNVHFLRMPMMKITHGTEVIPTAKHTQISPEKIDPALDDTTILAKNIRDIDVQSSTTRLATIAAEKKVLEATLANIPPERRNHAEKVGRAGAIDGLRSAGGPAAGSTSLVQMLGLSNGKSYGPRIEGTHPTIGSVVVESYGKRDPVVFQGGRMMVKGGYFEEEVDFPQTAYVHAVSIEKVAGRATAWMRLTYADGTTYRVDIGDGGTYLIQATLKHFYYDRGQSDGAFGIRDLLLSAAQDKAGMETALQTLATEEQTLTKAIEVIAEAAQRVEQKEKDWAAMVDAVLSESTVPPRADTDAKKESLTPPKTTPLDLSTLTVEHRDRVLHGRIPVPGTDHSAVTFLVPKGSASGMSIEPVMRQSEPAIVTKASDHGFPRTQGTISPSVVDWGTRKIEGFSPSSVDATGTMLAGTVYNDEWANALLYDMQSGKEKRIGGNFRGGIYTAISSDGTRVITATAGQEGVMRLYDIRTGAQIGDTQRPAYVSQLAFRPGSSPDTLHGLRYLHRVMWGAADGGGGTILENVWPYFSASESVAAAPRILKLQYGEEKPGTTAELYNFNTKSTLPAIDTGKTIAGLLVSPDGTMLLTWDPTGTIEVWDIATKKISTTISPAAGGHRIHAQFADSGKILIVTDNTGTLREFSGPALKDGGNEPLAVRSVSVKENFLAHPTKPGMLQTRTEKGSGIIDAIGLSYVTVQGQRLPAIESKGDGILWMDFSTVASVTSGTTFRIVGAPKGTTFTVTSYMGTTPLGTAQAQSGDTISIGQPEGLTGVSIRSLGWKGAVSLAEIGVTTLPGSKPDANAKALEYMDLLDPRIKLLKNLDFGSKISSAEGRRAFHSSRFNVLTLDEVVTRHPEYRRGNSRVDSDLEGEANRQISIYGGFVGDMLLQGMAVHLAELRGEPIQNPLHRLRTIHGQWRPPRNAQYFRLAMPSEHEILEESARLFSRDIDSLLSAQDAMRLQDWKDTHEGDTPREPKPSRQLALNADRIKEGMILTAKSIGSYSAEVRREFESAVANAGFSTGEIYALAEMNRDTTSAEKTAKYAAGTTFLYNVASAGISTNTEPLRGFRVTHPLSVPDGKRSAEEHVSLPSGESVGYAFTLDRDVMANFWTDQVNGRSLALSITGNNLPAGGYPSSHGLSSANSVSLKLTKGTYTVILDDTTPYDVMPNGNDLQSRKMQFPLRMDIQPWNTREVMGKVSLPGETEAKAVSLRVAEFLPNGKRNDNFDGTDTNKPNVNSLDPSKPVWVVVHGKDNSENSSQIAELTKNLSSLGVQVVTLDWSEGASDNLTPIGLEGSKWIEHIGGWGARQIQSLGIPRSNLHIIGHSWGAYVAYEIGTHTSGGAQTLVALDPAADTLILGGGQYKGFNEKTFALSNAAASSYAFHSSNFGNKKYAQSAEYAFNVVVPENYEQSVADSIALNTALLKNAYVGLGIATADEIRDAYHEHGFAVSLFTELLQRQKRVPGDVTAALFSLENLRSEASEFLQKQDDWEGSFYGDPGLFHNELGDEAGQSIWKVKTFGFRSIDASGTNIIQPRQL